MSELDCFFPIVNRNDAKAQAKTKRVTARNSTLEKFVAVYNKSNIQIQCSLEKDSAINAE